MPDLDILMEEEAEAAPLDDQPTVELEEMFSNRRSEMTKSHPTVASLLASPSPTEHSTVPELVDTQVTAQGQTGDGQQEMPKVPSPDFPNQGGDQTPVEVPTGETVVTPINTGQANLGVITHLPAITIGDAQGCGPGELTRHWASLILRRKRTPISHLWGTVCGASWSMG